MVTRQNRGELCCSSAFTSMFHLLAARKIYSVCVCVCGWVCVCVCVRVCVGVCEREK